MQSNSCTNRRAHVRCIIEEYSASSLKEDGLLRIGSETHRLGFCCHASGVVAGCRAVQAMLVLRLQVIGNMRVQSGRMRTQFVICTIRRTQDAVGPTPLQLRLCRGIAGSSPSHQSEPRRGLIAEGRYRVAQKQLYFTQAAL